MMQLSRSSAVTACHQVACSNCGHVFNRTDLRPGDIVRCNESAPAVPVIEVRR